MGIDEISLMLGEMRARLASMDEALHNHFHDDRVMSATVAQIANDVSILVVSTSDFAKMKKQVAKHEGAYQRTMGICVAIAGSISLFSSGAVQWIEGHLK